MSSTDNLLIFGASARAAAFSALRAGLRPWCADLFADADLRGRCPAMRLPGRYPLGFLELIETEIPGPWMYTGALENHPFTVAQMADRRRLWGNNAGQLLPVRTPYALGPVARSVGLPAPRTTPGPRPVAGGRWLVKPIAGGGGAGIHLWPPGGTDIPAGHYLQELIDGSPVSAVFVGNGKKALLLGVTRQLIGEEWLRAPAFRYCGNVGPLEVADSLQIRLQKLGDALVGLAGLVGLFGVDGLLCAARGEFWPVEVNPRYPASVEVLEHARGVPAMRLHRHGCVERGGDWPAWEATAGGVVGKAILYARADGAFPESGPWDGHERVPVTALPDFADLPGPGEGVEEGRPVLTLLARGPDEAAVLAELRRRAAEVERLLSGGLQ